MDDNNAESPQRRRRESFFFIGDTESGNNVHQFNPLLPPLLLNSNTPSSAKRLISEVPSRVTMSQDAEDGPEMLFSGCTAYTTRPPMNQEEFDRLFNYSRPTHQHDVVTRRVVKCACGYCKPFKNFVNTVCGFVPILSWLPHYNWRRDVLADVVGGLTVGVMHVPQGIAYAILAKVPPIVGLYTSFFPALFYMIFGTSRHNSIGSFAVVGLMSGQVVDELRTRPPVPGNSSAADDGENDVTSLLNNEAVVISSTLALCVGLIQLLMGVLHMEIVTTYFSDQLISGFSTAASCHVLVTQLKSFFGILHLPRRQGPANLFYKFYDIVINIGRANTVTVGISLVSVTLLTVAKDFLSPALRRYTHNIPIPFDLILVVMATLMSAFFAIDENYGVQVVNEIPTGFPTPMIPSVERLPSMLPNAFSISIVVLAIHISLAKMFAKKLSYKVDPGQELYAMGLSASLASFFPIYPVSCSLGRTIVNVEAGTKTQLSTVFSSILLCAIILYVGQWLRSLPMCILAVIIIVALKGMLKKWTDLRLLWPLSKIDFSIWLVSFVATVAWDVTEGLAVSIVYALMTTVFRTQWPRWHFLANLSGTNDFRDAERYHLVVNHPGICIFRFDSPLLFTNVERFKANIHNAFEKWQSERYRSEIKGSKSGGGSAANAATVEEHLEQGMLTRTVMDASSFPSTDPSPTIFTEMRNIRVLVYFAATKAPVRDLFEKCGFYKYVPKHNFYPTIRDAVSIARKRRNASAVQLLEETSLQYDRLDDAINAHPMN